MWVSYALVEDWAQLMYVCWTSLQSRQKTVFNLQYLSLITRQKSKERWFCSLFLTPTSLLSPLIDRQTDPCTGKDWWEMEQAVYLSLCTSTQHPLISSYPWCLAFFLCLSSPGWPLSFSFPSLHPWFLSYLSCIPYFYCPSLQSSHLFISPIAVDLFQSLRFPVFFSSLPAPLSLIPSLQFPCPSHSFVSFPSLLISFPCCLSSLACTAVAASQAIKQWEFSTQQMCWWMGGWVEKVEGGQRTGWMLGGARTTYTCLFQVRNVTEHSFF